MAKKNKRRGKQINKWELKQWFEVYAPKTFNQSFIGLVPAASGDKLIGTTLQNRLYELTEEFKDTRKKITYKITGINGKRADTKFWGFELSRDYIHSNIHRGKTRIDGIFNFTTADDVIYRVMTLAVTEQKAKRSQKTTIRNIMNKVLTEYASNMNHDEFIRGLIYGKFANNIARIAKSIYPLYKCETAKVKVLYMPDHIKDALFVDGTVEVEEVEVELEAHGKKVSSAKKDKRQKHTSPESDEALELVSAADSE